MPFNVAKTAIDKYLSREDGPEVVSIDFSGGEPLLEFDLIKKVFEYCTTQGSWNKKFRMSLGTNGTVLTKEMREWFTSHPCFQISLSLDGTKEVHDYNRSNSYDKIIENIDFFRQYDQTVKMTISP
jgi:sulfatase maturation enzyme AslB (radical SAM superfamily)